jgi:Spy/CpxP family protein refolding chaperone
MTPRIALVAVITAALSAGGLMAVEDNSLHHSQRARANFVDRMSTALSLTDRQKQQAKTIFSSEREAARPIRQELRQERQTWEAAIRNGKSPAEVQQIAKNEGPALGNLAGMRAAAFAKFYADLTPAQQQKLAGLRQEWRQHKAERAPSGNAPETN